MTPREAQDAYVAADERWQDHRRQCYNCGNSRLKYRHSCLEGDPLHEAALAARQKWAAAVAAERAAS